MNRYIRIARQLLTDADYRFLLLAGFGLFDSWDDVKYLKRKFRATIGKELNLENPNTFNEKLQWLKLYNRRPEYTMMVDKYLVRDYIAKAIGEEYLIPLLGVWDDPNEIDFNKLPDQFVLKCNHNSGLGMCICKDKSNLDLKTVRKELRKGLKQNYFLTGREWPYKDIQRKIVCEQYMEDSSGELMDYKVLCFDGEPKLIELHQGRFSGNHTQDFYDTNWMRTNITQCGEPLSPSLLPKPECLEEMLSLTRKLADGMSHVRIDWYVINGRLYFGEITFFDASGFDPFDRIEDDMLLGSWITLPMR